MPVGSRLGRIRTSFDRSLSSEAPEWVDLTSREGATSIIILITALPDTHLDDEAISIEVSRNRLQGNLAKALQPETQVAMDRCAHKPKSSVEKAGKIASSATAGPSKVTADEEAIRHRVEAAGCALS